MAPHATTSLGPHRPAKKLVDTPYNFVGTDCDLLMSQVSGGPTDERSIEYCNTRVRTRVPGSPVPVFNSMLHVEYTQDTCTGDRDDGAGSFMLLLLQYGHIIAIWPY